MDCGAIMRAHVVHLRHSPVAVGDLFTGLWRSGLGAGQVSDVVDGLLQRVADLDILLVVFQASSAGLDQIHLRVGWADER